ncbi:large ribosomal subunit protein uL1m isoform X1 [Cherax quadricarinatus]|uniref:large ribosomal subunit protein uL1m isoform X1 n=1 Tax=Cherax quadricarinatus TaxID=27406 RepID=UPI00387E71C1
MGHHLGFGGFLVQVLVQRWHPVSFGNTSYIHTGCVMEAARKGTRAKADAKKKASKKEEVKKEFIPLKKRLEMQQTGGASPRRKDDHLKDPIDNVWISRFYKWQMYSVRDAIAMHRETHHETQFNHSNALINAYIELDMSADKKNRYIDNFSNVIQLPYHFENEQQRTVLAISRNEEVIEQAWQMGVTLAAGLDVVKQVQSGEVSFQDIQHFIAEKDTLPDLVPIRGLMKRRFPSVMNGTAGSDIIPIIERFIKGVEYKTTTDKFHHDFATIEAPFGRLGMTDEQLEENLSALLNDVENQKPQKKSDQLITLVRLRTVLGPEQFKIYHKVYIRERALNVKVAAS